MNSNENIIDQILASLEPDPWKVGVYIDGQRVDRLPPRDGSCESDWFTEEPDPR